MKRTGFYLVVACLVVIDALLIRSPNLLGKVGLIIYKYHYLRTFPRALATLSIAIGIMIVIMELVLFLIRSARLSKFAGGFVLFFLLLASVALLIKTKFDFAAWTYSHTGQRFRYGAYMVPAIMILIFAYGLLAVRKIILPVATPPEATNLPTNPEV